MIIDLERFVTEERPHWNRLERMLGEIEHDPDRKLPLRGGCEHRLALRAVVFGGRAHLLHRVDDHPAASGGALVHRVSLQGQGALVVGRDTGREGNAAG